jgi:hypothetical protein
MAKKKKEKISKTLVEQILDKNKINYQAIHFSNVSRRRR